MKEIMAKALRMNKVFIVLAVAVILASFMLLTGCQKKAVKTEAPPPAVETKPEEIAKPKEPEKITEQKVEAVASKDVVAPHEESKEDMFADILFDYDKYDVKDSYKDEMMKVSAYMTKNSSATLSIEGHCDERGTNEYNLALGDRRAKAVKDYLVSLGVPSARIETISYGEERPVCAEQSEDCWTKNRRAHIVILTKAGK
ncbi:MAG: peptidoglycan-associated lipoprotein Pal [Nitrospirota bacterium]|nr:peptidoglycan-associated lipoprotein Pal [Nitrospirota bacterium]